MLQFVKRFNFILACDSYKLSHWKEIPIGTFKSCSTLVPRKPSKFSDVIVAMGHTFAANFLALVRITMEDIEEAQIEVEQQGYEFNRAAWEYIVNECGGKLPLVMYGVEEGTVVKPQTPIAAIINTDDVSAWLPPYVETIVQSTIWKMSTVASTARACKIIVKEFMVLTGADLSMLDYKVHNFGDRGADSPNEAAVLAGIAHAALFRGSDCTRANGYIKALYRTTKAYTSSVEATEHTTMCLNSDAASKDDWGAALMVVARLEDVVARSKRGIGIPVMSSVIDTYDSRRYVREYLGTRLKDRIIASGGVLVDRPDSGDPTIEPGLVGKDIEDTFGLAGVTSTGYKILHKQRSVLQGDGLNVYTIRSILQGWVDVRYSMDSFLVGMGGGMTHEGSRDTFSFSEKTIAALNANGWERQLKDPITDSGKRSLSGLMRCEYVGDELIAVDCTNDPERFFKESKGWRIYSSNGEQNYVPEFDDVISRANVGV